MLKWGVLALLAGCAMPGQAPFSVQQAEIRSITIENAQPGHYRVYLRVPGEDAQRLLGAVIVTGAEGLQVFDHPGNGSFQAQAAEGHLTLELGLAPDQKGQVVVARPLGEWSTREFFERYGLGTASRLASGVMKQFVDWMEKEGLMDIRQPISETVATLDL